MELDRHYIERKDFATARRGYDPDDVDRHLSEVAEAVAALKRQQKPSQATLAGTAADHVRTIVDAAEQSANAIAVSAEAEASRITIDAARRGQETRERADAQAAGYIESVEQATATMLQRAQEVDAEVTREIDSLRAATGSLVGELRDGAGSLRSQFDAIRAELSDARGARSEGLGAQTSAAPSAAPESGAVAQPAGELRAVGSPVDEGADGHPGLDSSAAASAPESGPGLVADQTADEPRFSVGQETATDVGAEAQAEPAPFEPAAFESAPSQEPSDRYAEPASLDPDFGPSGPEATGSDEPRFAVAEPAEVERDPAIPADHLGFNSGVADSVGADTDEGSSDAEAAEQHDDTEGARLVALNMALNGTPREETARYLAENFRLPDQDGLLNEVYARVSNDG